jgi:hypothetical protein
LAQAKVDIVEIELTTRSRGIDRRQRLRELEHLVELLLRGSVRELLRLLASDALEHLFVALLLFVVY